MIDNVSTVPFAPFRISYHQVFPYRIVKPLLLLMPPVIEAMAASSSSRKY